MEALWALLPLCVLLVAALVLFYRYHYRILRDRANAVLSRDRAHVDLQMMVHQAKKQVQTEADGSIASSKSRLPSLPPGPPSSAASETTAPPRMSNAEADRQHYAEAAAAHRAARPSAEQRALHLTWVEAGRRWFAERGMTHGRAALIASARVEAPASLSVERVELAELAALAEMGDDETVAALQDIVTPGHGGSTCSPAQPPHCWLMPVQANPQMQHAVPVHQCGAYLPAASACSSSISIPRLSAFGTDTSALKELFAKLFTPKHPSQMHGSQWVSLTRLAQTVKPYAPGQVWSKGPGNLKQLVIQWYRHHPVFAGLALNAWCKPLPDFDAPGHLVSKFCFAYTPN